MTEPTATGPVSLYVRLALGLFAAIAFLLSGCTGSASTNAQRSEALESYYATVSDPQLYRQAFADTIDHARLCMVSRGFELLSNDLPPPQWWDRASEFAAVADPSYIMGMSRVEAGEGAFGYALSIQSDRNGTTFDPFPMPDLDGDPSLSSPEEIEYANNLFGLVIGTVDGEIESETAGCLDEAEEKIGPLALPEHELEDAYEKLLASDVYSTFDAGWRDCMSVSGYTFRGEPLAFAAWISYLDRLTVEEFNLSTESPFAGANQLSANDLSNIEDLESSVALAHVECTDTFRSDLQEQWQTILFRNNDD